MQVKINIIKRDIFIGDLAGGAAVFVPGIDDLAVFDKGGKFFPKAVNRFAGF